MRNKRKQAETFYCITDGNDMELTAWTDHSGKHRVCFVIGDDGNDQSRQVVLGEIQSLKLIQYITKALEL